MSEIVVKASSTKQHYITDITADVHRFTVDEPLDKGGQNTAAKPSELLGAALASCTSVTLEMYLTHKEWAYDKVEVEVNFDWITTEAITFKRHVVIKGNFDEKQQTRLLKVSNSCPIHKVLEKGHLIETTIAFI